MKVFGIYKFYNYHAWERRIFKVRSPRSSKVEVGQTVKEGQEIAKVGMTGYILLPHLHFQVFVFTGRNVWVDFDTLKVQDFIS
ncbi:MAG: M23 family metallopeptidase [Candidatus Nitrosopolaris sp.]